jgi:predicted enzyme related to lactoylglutathione lyase
MANPFVHIELMTPDVEKAKAFYGKLLDWKLEDMPVLGVDHAYTMIRVGEGTGGGIMKNPMPGGGSVWVPYVNVNDIRAATDKAKSLGGKVHKDAVDIDFGIFSIVEDPGGSMIGLWQQKQK